MRIARRVVLTIATIALLGLARTASASTIWTLNNVDLFCSNCAVGGLSNTITGSFELNPALTQVIDWDITVSGAFSGIDYHYSSALNPGNSSVFLFTPTDITFNDLASPFNPYLSLVFASPLSNNVPATIALVPGSPVFGQATFTCGPLGNGSPCGLLDDRIVTGTVSGVDPPSVPEPATLCLIGTGLVGMGARLRRRARKS